MSMTERDFLFWCIAFGIASLMALVLRDMIL